MRQSHQRTFRAYARSETDTSLRVRTTPIRVCHRLVFHQSHRRTGMVVGLYSLLHCLCAAIGAVVRLVAMETAEITERARATMETALAIVSARPLNFFKRQPVLVVVHLSHIFNRCNGNDRALSLPRYTVRLVASHHSTTLHPQLGQKFAVRLSAVQHPPLSSTFTKYARSLISWSQLVQRCCLIWHVRSGSGLNK